MASTSGKVPGVDEKLSTPLSPADTAILRTPQSQGVLAKLVTYLPLVQLQLGTLRGSIPSYVNIAIDGLIAAVKQWQKDTDNHGR